VSSADFITNIAEPDFWYTQGAPLPESLPIEPPISEVRKRLGKESKATLPPPKSTSSST
jgi:hypothetical protein